MIATDNHSGLVSMYDIEDRLTLPFVTKAVAELMLYIGIALNLIGKLLPQSALRRRLHQKSR